MFLFTHVNAPSSKPTFAVLQLKVLVNLHLNLRLKLAVVFFALLPEAEYHQGKVQTEDKYDPKDCPTVSNTFLLGLSLHSQINLVLDVFDIGSLIDVLVKSADLWLLVLMIGAANPLKHLVSLHLSVVGLAVYGQ